MITAIKIEKIIQTGAAHSLYRETGDWYHHLKYFPGVLFDLNVYVTFQSENDYINSPYLRHAQDLNVPDGISSIPGYQYFTNEEKDAILEIL